MAGSQWSPKFLADTNANRTPRRATAGLACCPAMSADKEHERMKNPLIAENSQPRGTRD
jgi:hypothetical protein